MVNQPLSVATVVTGDGACGRFWVRKLVVMLLQGRSRGCPHRSVGGRRGGAVRPGGGDLGWRLKVLIIKVFQSEEWQNSSQGWKRGVEAML
jgi:hypothetical protein